jgi:multisubunit Na+/H+ antiporter MnhB subunit
VLNVAIMSSLINTLNNISLNIYIYVGLVELVVGTVGNVLTIIVFSQAPLRSTRTMPCIIALAVVNIIFLNYALISRAIVAIYGRFDYTFGSNILCAVRYFIPYTSMCIAFLLLSWMAIDR